jgi:hypothetical protein
MPKPITHGNTSANLSVDTKLDERFAVAFDSDKIS